MTVEEIEIIVSAKVQEALKEFKKILPSVKKQLSSVKKEFDNLNIKDITAKVNIKEVKKQVQEIKKEIKDAFDPNDISGMKINGKDFEIKHIKGYSREVQKLKAELGTLNKFRTEPIKAEATEPIKADVTKPNKIEKTSETKSPVEENKYSTWTNIIRQYYAWLDKAKGKIYEIGQESNKTGASQKNLTGFFNGFKTKIEQTKNGISNIKEQLSDVSRISIKINNNIKNMVTGLKTGFGTVLKYAGALFGIKTIYSTLRNSASAWLNSQNAQAQQLSANIEYLKYAMGSVFAPVIEYVINLVYELMKAIQSLVYAFSGINIFAKATANSMRKTAGSAKQASKSLAGVHNEINNVSENNSGGSGKITPSMDLTEMDNSINSWAERVKEKLLKLFEPIKNSWNVYGQPLIDSAKRSFSELKELISSIGGSLEEVWLNGTGEETINTILQGFTDICDIVGNIGMAFTNAWNNGNVGTMIIQILWDGFNNLLTIIGQVFKVFEEWTSSQSFQAFASSIIGMCNVIAGWFEKITQKLREIWENGGRETLTNLLEFITKVSEAINVALNVLTPVVDYILAIVTPIIQGIIKIIGDVIDALSGVLDFIIGIFTGDWERAWGGIKKYYEAIWNAIKDIVQTIMNFVWTYISNALKMIKNVWTTIWGAIKTVVVTVWNGIWSVIKNIINLILGGIEGMANGIVKGVNAVIKVLNKLKFSIPDWIPGFGGKTFGFNIQSLSMVTLPRLEKGNVAYDETLAIFGEYSGASNNPEITTPQNIMRETFEDVLSNYNNNGQPVHITIQYLGREIFDDTIEYINSRTRRTGRNTIVTVGD